MKKLIILSTILLTMISCKIQEKPEFLRVENIEIIESNASFIVLSGQAFFNNPNSIGGKLETEGIKVIINDVEMATIATKTFDVPAKKEFSIPLEATIPSKKIFNTKNLNSILNSVLNKGMQVQYSGDIKYKILGFSHRYTIDEIQDVKIKI